MHDQLNLEELGIPGVFIASEEFRDASDTQGTALGMDPRAVFVPHPIQDRTDEEMRGLADGAFEKLLGQLIGEK